MGEQVVVNNLRVKKKTRKEKILLGLRQWLEVAPYILIGMALITIFVIYPQIKNIYMSFTKYNIMPGAESPFIGLDNYKLALFGEESEKFWLAFRNVILYGIFTIPPGLIIGLILAVLINNVKKFNLFYRGALYLPVLIDWIVVAIIFIYIFQDGDGGLANYILMKFHIIKEPIGWLQNTWTANAVIWVFGLWKNVGWTMFIYLAGLQNISKDIYEAAAIDGATPAKKFFKITLPLLKNTTFFILINLIIGSFNVFIAVYMLTQGGPLGTTDVLQNYMYNQAFKYFNFGYACALSVMIGLSIILLTAFKNKFFKYERN
ncbi:carbohydrate ABC transporter membrane protein 1, CUT1 family [Clostridium cavendishii DSM 21758]|uniref:Carbohydrate ABC transporter membrane protein 1, CUT1 family n=1 Tax=Clostridium cavendishii DSM 21758 TaxID=1121302 RepID=A0A1M6HV86_9CLOT|nr:sugar ABC transporter permease [Clostridium cavendishii]SHJ26038.1 carbohydrate ABC transporter membrane protein 1, CUT1 family [Clostridium cavendishii DSM 21758]